MHKLQWFAIFAKNLQPISLQFDQLQATQAYKHLIKSLSRK